MGYDMGMETTGLSADELAMWETLVERGREIRAPLQEKKLQDFAERSELFESMKGKFKHKTDPSAWNRKKRRKYGVIEDTGYVIPDPVKKFIVYRASGMTFSKAGAASGATWHDISLARFKSEELMCAVEGMEEASRFLLRMKAMSVLEDSQEEGSRPNANQVFMAESILKRLDYRHFGDDVGRNAAIAGEVKKELGNGGFIVNLISDAAEKASKAPEAKPAKALVYTDV